MTDTFITQCPHCNTRFRLKHSQLSAAQGSVRCGACSQVFNAASQISDTQATPVASATPPPAAAVTASAKPAQVIITPKLIAPIPVEPTPTPRLTLKPPADDNSTPVSTSKKPLMIHDDMDLSDLDDFDLDQELARLEKEERQRSKELSGEFAALLASSKPSPAPIEDSFDEQAAEGLKDDWSDELLSHEPVAQLSSQPEEVEEPAAPAHRVVQRAQEDTSSTPSPFQPPQHPIHMEPLPMGGKLPNFNDGPLRLDWKPKRNPWRRWLGWGILNICALLLLLGQYSYNNFGQLARQDSTRPWLDKICPIVGCQLPSKVDVQQIKSSNLLVRNHPEFRGALLVDAIIYNRASFTQPFPLLKLTFSDAFGHILASRLFKPQEYLSGELAGQSQMPQQTPIHIALEILAPKGGAINYSLDFIAPD